MKKRLIGKLCLFTLLAVAGWQIQVFASGCEQNLCWLDNEYAIAMCSSGQGQEAACDSMCEDNGYPMGSNDHYCEGSTLWCECNGDHNR